MRRRTIIRTTFGTAVTALLVATTSCGTGSEPVASEREPASSGEWELQELDLDVGPDSEPPFATDGAEAIIVTAGEDGAVSSLVSTGGGPFRAGEPHPTDLAPLWLGAAGRLGDDWIVLGSGGSEEVDGDTTFRKDPVVLRSADGTTWEQLEATGFSGPVDIEESVVADDAMVVVGARREEGDPGSEQFTATAWRSTDGRSWKETRLPDATASSYAVDVVDAGDRLLALGGIGNKTVAWASDDDGATWARTTLDGVLKRAHVNFIAGRGDVLVATGFVPSPDSDEGAGTGHLAYRSTDGGRHWAPAAQPPPDQGEQWGYPAAGRDGRFFVTTSTYLESWSQPEVCYADIDQCRQDSEVVLYTSDDGDRWERVDTSGFGTGEAGEIDDITTLEDGTVIAGRAGEHAWTIGRWPGDVDLPTAPPPTKTTVEIDLLEQGDTPEVGHRYAAPLHIHCGMDWLYLGEQPWQRTDDGPDVETGAGEAASADWPVAQQTIFGFATLVDDDTVEYSIGDGEVIATYGRPTQDPVPCM